MWFEVMRDYDLASAKAGAISFMAADTSGFPPTPGQIIEYIRQVKQPEELSPLEAWGYVRKAVNSPRDQYEAAYEHLPELVQKTLSGKERGVAQLKVWGGEDMRVSTFETVEQSNFLRSYEATRTRMVTEQKIPQALLELRDKKGMIPGEPHKRLETVVAHERAEAPSDRIKALRSRLGAKE